MKRWYASGDVSPPRSVRAIDTSGGPFAVVAPAWGVGFYEQPSKGTGGGGGSREKFAESALVVRRRVCRMTVHILAPPTQMPRNVCLHRRLNTRHEYSHALSSPARANGGCGGRASGWCVAQLAPEGEEQDSARLANTMVVPDPWNGRNHCRPNTQHKRSHRRRVALVECK